MTSNTMVPADSTGDAKSGGVKSERLYYLDWLQVLAILGVFLFHAIHPFDALADWHIKNAEKSVLATFFIGFFNLWGMPFFFLMAGATSWFSLRRRTPGPLCQRACYAAAHSVHHWRYPANTDPGLL